MTGRNTTAPPAPLPRIVFLDGLRGFAALMVVLFHYWTGAKKPSLDLSLGTVHLNLLAPMEYFGGARVSLFFVLSGFLLYLPFARTPDRCVSLSSWLWQRFRRVAPPYYAAIVLALLPVFGSYYVQEAARWLRHLPHHPIQVGTALIGFPEVLLFAHGMVPGKQNPMINAPLWTMTPEVQLYLTFPLLAFFARRKGTGGLAGIVVFTVIASVAYRLYLYHAVGYSFVLGGAEDSLLPDAYHCLTNSFLGRWAEFALGMGAAGLVVRNRVPSAYLLVPVGTILLVLFLALRNGWAANTPFTALMDAAGGAAFATLILCCAVMPSVASVFTMRPLTWLGSFAYSLYLVHSPVWVAVGRFEKSVLHLDTEAGGWTMLAVNLLIVFPIALIVARLFWLCFERPFLTPALQTALRPHPSVINREKLQQRKVIQHG